MADMLDDGLETLADELILFGGQEFIYRNGAGGATETVSARICRQPPIGIDNGNGLIIEVRPVDFIVKTIDLPYGKPAKGHRIETGSTVYEVQPTVSEKCFRELNAHFTRIHTKQIT